ncbi:hypothetical protein JX266_002524 [Neoarthrinium moseri]|nr:hypothetical protein JX266_002524 [Neoarthrinium moseri]
MAPKEPKVDAPPLSSDDEDEKGYSKLDSSDSEDDRQRTADIVPSFPKESSSAGNARKTALGRKVDPPEDLSLSRISQNTTSTSSAGPKRSSDGIAGASGKNFLEEDISRPRKRNRPAYGKKVKESHVKRSSISRADSPERKSFKRVEVVPSPTKNSNSGAGFKEFPLGSSPASSPAKSGFRTGPLISDESPQRPGSTFIKPTASSHDIKPARLSLDRTGFKRPTKGLRRQNPTRNGQSNEDPEGTPTQKPTAFKMPDMKGMDDVDDVDDSRPIPDTQQLGLLLDEEIDSGMKSDSDVDGLDHILPGGPLGSRCPMCHETVDQELLKKHLAGGSMNVRRQSAFCRLHKRKEAQDHRKTKGYPDVDWGNIESRLQMHTDIIENILQGQRLSHYASLFQKRVESGENRMLLKTNESLIPGYYGPRGLRVMSEFITKNFSDTLRKRAVEDRLVSSRGYSGYMQAVLVPELAIRLIMEDMSVTEEDARGILSDSCDVGELVHEETRDVVRWSDDEGGEN